MAMTREEAVRRFTELYKEHIAQREGGEALWSMISDERVSDFFKAPASTRFHGAFAGGLVIHSVNVYDCLRVLVSRKRWTQTYGNRAYTEREIATVSLLHDFCKVNCYRETMRNVKKDGVWIAVPSYEYDDRKPYGHGEKSVYYLSKYLKDLSDEEAYAIRFHMGFSEEEDKRTVGAAFEKYPLAVALSFADMEATYYLEGKKEG